MAIAKKQHEVQLNLRAIATDVDQPLTQANMTIVLDDCVMNGVSLGDAVVAALAGNAALLAAVEEMVADQFDIVAA
jgi:hypothetical protein